VVVAGEACPRDVVRRWAPGRRLVNAYGPTEATVCATMTGPLPVATDDPPIGRPVVGARVYVLDSELREVGPGVIGDLYVAGAGVADGYLNRPGLTAQSFVPDPFGPPGARMYRTGDLASRAEDGQLRFHGRVDDQVKIRGYRVELGEVQSVLSDHPGVAHAAVTLRGDPAGGAGGRLIAYAAPAPGHTLGAEELRRHLATVLPGYMLPAAYVMLDRLPTTPSGKIDRAALPPPPAAGTAGAPRTDQERLLAALFAEVLGLPEAGVEDDFFAIGGNSLLATRLAGEVHRRFGVELSLDDLLRRPTVEAAAALLPRAPAPTVPERPALEGSQLDRGELDGVAPLLFGQEQVWFLERLAGAGRAYHYQLTIDFTGDLRVDALRQALTGVVRRHQALRTTYVERDGRPVQVVHPPYRVELPVHDLRVRQADPPAGALRAELARESERGFDLAELPLVRWHLYRTGAHAWTLVETGHHMLHDGWSAAVVWNEVEELYRAHLAGRPPRLPGPPPSPGRHAVRQREEYERRREALLDYWREALAGVTPLDLPVARQRPPRQTFAGATRRVTLPFPLYQKLRDVSRAHGCTLYLTMYTAFVALLHRYTGEPDLCVGSWFANRGGPESDQLVGMLVNMVAMRHQVRGEASFRELLDDVRQTFAGAYAHQQAPFHHVVREVAPARDPSRNPVVQVCFSFHDSAMPTFDWPGVTGTLVERSNGSAKFDLNVIVVPQAEQRQAATARPGVDELVMIWEYNADLFPTGVVNQLIAHYEQVLRGVVKQPDQPVATLNLLTDAEQRQLASWQGPELAMPDSPIHELVLAQAAATPEAVAIRCGDQHWRYAELAARTGDLARRLAGAGVGPGDLVAVCVERTPALVAGFLAVMATGAAYVPLDPRHPAHRNRTILNTVRPAAILADSSTRAALAQEAARLVLADVPAGAGGGPAGRDRAGAPGPATGRAYVIFTSGTTGRPRGVEVAHRSLTNLIMDMRHRLEVADSDVLTAVTTVSFDIAALELYLPLVAGAQVDLAGEEVTRSGERLRQRLAAARATIMQATPATWRMLVEAGGWSTGQRFKALCGGETCPRDLADELLKRSSAAWNVYGPTETTIWSTAHRIRPGEGPVLIGRPLANTTCRVCDGYGNPVPVGVPGELYLGGAGVALGYFREPDLTAERFGHDPPAATPEGSPAAPGRWFRTGDLVRWSPGGELDFLGRNDRQVKLRGFRIELEEVEAILRRHRGVRDVAVLLQDDRPAVGPRLVAYVVGGGGQAGEAVRQAADFLRERVPAYMLPSEFVSVPALPTTPNRKVDRAILASMGVSSHEPGGRGASPPASEHERKLARIWADVLGLDSVDHDLSFFEAGGHSLLALKLVDRIQAELAVPVEVEAVFDHPTVRELAVVLASHPGGR
jgi:amino acid adenylation domain-containing protein